VAGVTMHAYVLRDPPTGYRYGGSDEPTVVAVSDPSGEGYSADARDYWYLPDTEPMGALVRLYHPWRTVSGRMVYAPRVVRHLATMRDLRRLARARDAMMRADCPPHNPDLDPEPWDDEPAGVVILGCDCAECHNCLDHATNPAGDMWVCAVCRMVLERAGDALVVPSDDR
jgi:hypothetical protein